MSKIYFSLFFAMFALFQTILIAEEGDIQRIIVPDEQIEKTNEEVSSIEEQPSIEENKENLEENNEIKVTEVDVSEAEENTVQDEETENANVVSEVSEPLAQNTETPNLEKEEISIDDKEAQRAEEAELQEVGAGEE